MKIILNNKEHFILEGAMLCDVIYEQIGEINTGIAVAINSKIIPINNWDITPLLPEDKLLIIKAT